jgi:hypothetical protein
MFRGSASQPDIQVKRRRTLAVVVADDSLNQHGSADSSAESSSTRQPRVFRLNAPAPQELARCAETEPVAPAPAVEQALAQRIGRRASLSGKVTITKPAAETQALRADAMPDQSAIAPPVQALANVASRVPLNAWPEEQEANPRPSDSRSVGTPNNPETKPMHERRATGSKPTIEQPGADPTPARKRADAIAWAREAIALYNISLEELKQIAPAGARAAALHRRRRSAAIAWAKEAIEIYSISIEDLNRIAPAEAKSWNW